MGTWDRHEPYRKRARKSGYRSRAAFKLLEIEKHFHILQGAQRVVDLCCGPGSWLQVVQQICSQDCHIIGIDSVKIQPLQGVEIIQYPIDDPELVPLLLAKFGSLVNVVLSDCAPKLTGSKTLDRQQQLFLAETSLLVAQQLLEKKGHFVSKLFQSEQFKAYEIRLKRTFDFVKSFKPKSSFKRSPEMYFIAKGFKGNST